MTLEQWEQNHWLSRFASTQSEIVQLLAVVDREISDASVEALSVDGRFMHAYDAALNLCAIALRACGFVAAKGQGHHKRTIASLVFTMGATYQHLSDQIELASRRRSQAMYDRVGVVEEVDADELLRTAVDLRAAVIGWLATNKPALLPKDSG